MSLQNTFILNLKKHRKNRGLSQMSLAELCDSSANYIGEIEMGRRTPSFYKIEKIAAALCVSPSELFYETDAKTTAYDETPRSAIRHLPRAVKAEISRRILAALAVDIDNAFNADNY
jgi:transcriptional regulator with XRE-family HTH domain